MVKGNERWWTGAIRKTLAPQMGGASKIEDWPQKGAKGAYINNAI
jgi:hypothetical protein